MNTYTAVILANHHQKGKKYPTALLPVHGKPILNWIIDILRECSKISSLIVIGPQALDGLLGMKYVTKRISPANVTAQNIRVPFFTQGSNNFQNTNGCLVIPSEMIFIKSRELDNFLAAYDLVKSDIAIPVIEPEKLKPFYENADNLPQIKMNMVLGLIAVMNDIRHFSTVIAILKKFYPERNFTEYKDQPFTFFPDIMSRQISLDKIELLPTNATSFFVSIDTKQQAICAQKILRRPYKIHFSKIKVILNPLSGKSKQLPLIGKMLGIRYRSIDSFFSPHQFEKRIPECLEEFGINAELVKTTNSENATAIAAYCAKKNYDLVIAAGGDGTINSVINGLAGTKTTFAAIPTGTVNVFALQLNLPVEIRSSCELIAIGNTKMIDLGKVNERYFSSLSGIGFEAYIMNRTQENIRGKIGPVAYLLSGISNFFSYRFKKIYFTINNEPHTNYGYIIMVSNGKYYSANIILSPLASMEDGLLDIIVFKSKRPSSFLRYLYKTGNAKLLDCPDIEHFQAKKISIERHGNHYVHVDGEHYGHTPVEINVIPSALKVIC
ncbi:MAG: YegS/Rv2252/BmrU family lipid kinase [Fibrobacter sp.]|nr:YegS/Rv2252/BmrU family lipid kinase [Fibrobacter sp.]